MTDLIARRLKGRIQRMPFNCLRPACILGLLLMPALALAGPWAPAPGQPGSTAIFKDDPAFVGWATGWENYNVGSNVDSEWQTPEKALGKAVGTSFDIVGLGRGGSITMTFDNPITNGDGWDFAVFENSFNDTFLELGYVEVSSDGKNFYRFDNNSLTKDPVPAFGAVDPTNITGYASKYRQGYGTPFDLEPGYFFWEEDDLSGLDLSSVTHVRIVDIIGDGSYSDSFGNIIYDPYPTVGSAGVDLDAVGVINSAPVPVPPAVWLLGSGLLGLVGIRRRYGRNAD